MTEKDDKSNQFDKFNDRSIFINSSFEKNNDTFPKDDTKNPAKKLTFWEKLKKYT